MQNFLKSQLETPVDHQSLLFRLVSSPFERLFAWGVRRRNLRFETNATLARRLPGKTISVGNLAAGGTGKSPITIAIARALSELGARPAVVTRGYGVHIAKGDGLVLLAGKLVLPPRNGKAWCGQLPDEARMTSVGLPGVPVVVGPDRYAAVRRLLDHGELATLAGGAVTHWILDDGFQHRQLARDLDVVLLDARCPFGNGKQLPQGTLRETPDALRRAGLVIFTRCERGGPRKEDFAAVAAVFSGPVVRATFTTRLPQSFATADEPVLLCSGVARPALIKDELQRQGVRIGEVYLVNDHAPFRRDELLRRASGCRSVITTAKDYWRDPSIFADLPIPLRLLDLDVAFDSDALWQALAQIAK